MTNKIFVRNFSVALLIIFLILVLVSFYFLEPRSDLLWYHSWIDGFSKEGFKYIGHDYPPIWPMYLYVLSYIKNYFVDNVFLKKLVIILPSALSYIFFIVICSKLLIKRYNSKIFSFIILLFITFNPAFIEDCIIQGQIDILPVFFVILSILTLINNKYPKLSLPFFTVGILIKFQMIAFFPVIAGMLLNKNYRRFLLPNILLSIIVVCIVLFPYYLVGNLSSIIKVGYINASERYNELSLNASSLWIFIKQYDLNHNNPMFSDYISDFSLLKYVTYKYVGMFMFSIFSFILFIRSYLTNKKNEFFILAWIANIVFYIFLTAMHERYIFYAVPISLLAAIYNKKLFILSILITYVASINMAVFLYGFSNWILLLRINCILLIINAICLVCYMVKKH